MNKCFEIKCATSQKSSPDNVPAPEPPSVEEAVKGRYENNVRPQKEELVPDQAQAPTVVPEDPETGRPEHIRAKHYVPDHVDEQAYAEWLIDPKKGVLGPDTKWAVVYVHDCTHDEGTGDPCEQPRRILTHGTVPEGV